MIKRILCPIDFSETSQRAFEYAAALAESVGAEVVVLHAFDVPATLNMAGQHTPADASLRVKLEQVRATSAKVHISYVLHAGTPGEVICWLAQDRQCDLIVLATHGRTGLSHLVFGSTTEYVVRHARCPVMTIRDRPTDEPALTEPKVLPRPAPRLM